MQDKTIVPRKVESKYAQSFESLMKNINTCRTNLNDIQDQISDILMFQTGEKALTDVKEDSKPDFDPFDISILQKYIREL